MEERAKEKRTKRRGKKNKRYFLIDRSDMRRALKRVQYRRDGEVIGGREIIMSLSVEKK